MIQPSMTVKGRFPLPCIYISDGLPPIHMLGLARSGVSVVVGVSSEWVGYICTHVFHLSSLSRLLTGVIYVGTNTRYHGRGHSSNILFFPFHY